MDNDTKKSIIETKKALAVLYSLLQMKSKEREKVIISVRKVHEIDAYSDIPGELDLNPAHIDSAVLYSIEDILYPKKTKTFSKKMN